MNQRHNLDPMHLATPQDYEQWTADQKSQWLWVSLIQRTAHRPTGLPSLVLPFRTAPLTEVGIVVRPRELDKALTRQSDLMEPGRPKLIHAKGAVAMIELDPVADSRFTGLLGPKPNGGAIGLIRMSLVAKVYGGAAYTPALALKFLIDSKRSADVLAMNHTVGQGRDFNLFSNTMTNDLTSTHNELRIAQKIMSTLFGRVSRQPRRMVSTHLADCARDGTTVENPVAPDRLVFHPTPVARDVFSGRAGVDFRIVLKELDAGTPLYTVTGVSSSGRDEVGTIRMTTPFVSSDGGDRLFFQHVHDPEDRKLRN